ncbi:MAG TPA: hypothetical protein VK141_02680, partial [Nitrosomonas sp.]|nr:hypothetical protein [Nitrosomonas sp.]
MEKKFIVTYMVPVTIKLTDHVVPKADEVIAALVKTARKMIMDKNFNPVHIEEAYEVISEDKARENEILGDIDKRSEADHDLGAAGRQDTD